jgi:hypothetical protein
VNRYLLRDAASKIRTSNLPIGTHSDFALRIRTLLGTSFPLIEATLLLEDLLRVRGGGETLMNTPHQTNRSSREAGRQKTAAGAAAPPESARKRSPNCRKSSTRMSRAA